MAAPIDFWFDLASPYAWFLAEPLEQLAAEHGREVHWHPILLWAVLKQIGMPPPLENEAKKRYALHDMHRSAQFFGREFRLPSRFPLSSHLPARAFHALAERDLALAKRFAGAVFGAYFQDDADLGSPEPVALIGATLGIDRTAMDAAMNGEAAKEALKQANQSAAGHGVWGSPYVLIDGEAYFGADRLPQMRAQLEGRLRT